MNISRRILQFGAWLLCWLAAGIAPSPAVDPSLSLLFPVFDSGENQFVGLSLVNTGRTANEATVTWTNAEGTGIRTGSVSLLPGAQRALLVREILGLPREPRDGWIRIESAEPGLLAYLTSGTNGILDGTEPVSQPATAIFLEHIAVNTGFLELYHTDTLATFVNPGNAAANARLELIGMDGRTAGSLALSIPRSGSRTIRVSESFRDALPSNNLGGRTFDGSMKVLSDAGLASWLQVETPLSRRLLRGRAAEEVVPVSLALAGHFAAGSAPLYRSVLNLINPGDTPLDLELQALDDRGNGLGSIARRSLEPGGGIREDVLSLFRVVVPAVFPPPLITGHIRIRAAGGSAFQVIGDVDIHSAGNAAAMLCPITTAASLAWTLPFVVSNSDYFTGYAIANPNELLTVQTDVTVELLDAEGRLAAPPRTISLSPAARFVGLVDKEMQSGYLRIQSNLPVAVLGSIGTCSGTALASLPALR